MPGYLVGQLFTGLALGHDLHRRFEASDLAGVEAGRGQRDVTQRRGAKNVVVVGGLGHRKADLVAFGQHVGAGLLDQTKGEGAFATDIDAGVAGGADLVHEQLETGRLGGAECSIVAIEINVERRRRSAWL